MGFPSCPVHDLQCEYVFKKTIFKKRPALSAPPGPKCEFPKKSTFVWLERMHDHLLRAHQDNKYPLHNNSSTTTPLSKRIRTPVAPTEGLATASAVYHNTIWHNGTTSAKCWYEEA